MNDLEKKRVDPQVPSGQEEAGIEPAHGPGGKQGKPKMAASTAIATLPSIPSVGRDGNLSAYLAQIRRFPMLELEEEYMLATRWRDHEDTEAAHKLVTSHLRLVAKIAMGYRGYGLPVAELVSEGNVGMMQAVKRFDPERGFRLATYAMWWIRAFDPGIHPALLVAGQNGHHGSAEKTVLQPAQDEERLNALEEGDLSPDNVKKIATELKVSEEEVVNMNRRLAAPDNSLNAPLRNDGEGGGEWQDWLVDEDQESQETIVADREELKMRQAMLAQAMKTLNPRERHILTERRLQEEPQTLEELSQEYGISRERVRQIEVARLREAAEGDEEYGDRAAGRPIGAPAGAGATLNAGRR